MDDNDDKAWKAYYESLPGKLELCIIDLIFNSGYGLVCGTIVSRYFLGGRRFPHFTGIAIGVCATYFGKCKFLFGQLLIVKMSNDDPKDTILARIDMCISDIVFKSGLGLFVGHVIGRFCFPGHRWPSIVGIAVGSSHAWAQCRVLRVYRHKVRETNESEERAQTK